MTRPGRRVQVPISAKPSMTKQEFRDSTDINNILSKYQKTGVIEHYNTHKADYGFANSITFTEAEQLVARAESMFEELPSQARVRFDNDPGKFLDFVDNLDPDDPVARDQMVELGLLAEGAPTGDDMRENFRKANALPPVPEPPEPHVLATPEPGGN